MPISFVSRSATRLVTARPWIYDRVQGFFGLKQARERLAPYIADACGKRILDVGAGTGLYRSLAPSTATYIWVDIDWTKLEGFRRRTPGGLRVSEMRADSAFAIRAWTRPCVLPYRTTPRTLSSSRCSLS